MTTLSPCGTRTAYKRHRRHGEDPCDACREASRIANRKYGEQYNEKRRERRRLEGKAQRAAKTPRDPATLVVDMPKVVQGPQGVGPCAVPANGFVWDPKRDDETPRQARERHRVARAICVTACPVFARCHGEAPRAGGVVAGVIGRKGDDE